MLTGGRLRLGIGIGWNEVEYEALGESFTNRGRRSEEQIELLRLLWTQESVDFHGRYHNITNAGINPLPVQRPIPIWLGGGEGTGGPPCRQDVRRLVPPSSSPTAPVTNGSTRCRSTRSRRDATPRLSASRAA